jgi:lysophospholipase L1-like esterase
MLTIRRLSFVWVLAGVLVALGVGQARAQDNLLKGCDFSKGIGGWNGVGSDDKKEVALVDLPGGQKAIRLARKAEGGEARIDQRVRLKPQTLYKFSITGFGKAATSMRLRPGSSKDDKFDVLYKPWAVSSAPLIVGDQPRTTDFILDSGLKADSTAVMVYLTEPKDLNAFHITALSLTEAGSAKPAAEETIILHLGDSITISSYLPFEQRVEAILQPLLAKALPGRKIRQINVAVDGESVKALLETGRYEKVVKENYERVDVAIVRYGGNDSRVGTPEDFKGQLGTLCDRLKKDYPNVTILLGTGPWLKGADHVNIKQYGPYWKAMREFAQQRGLGLVDINARFEKEQSDKLTRSPSDQHPSPEGVRVMADEILPALKAVLGSK